ncbi:MAG TPA: hypothetical protein VMT95_06975 [Candidatus Binatia bacterium]|nr:hypothetical protein [Candidatus Binatia bacterium]
MRLVAVAAGVVFAAFVSVKGVPTLRHDWNWPIVASAIPSFVNEMIGGWLPNGFGMLNAHPTMYAIALPIGLGLWVFGPLAALALFAFCIGWLSARNAIRLAQRSGAGAIAAAGIGAFALFNPWVYNEVVAGHLVMVLAYAGVIGLIGEMLRGTAASPVRLALWLVLVETQLQFFIVAMLALAIFAFATKKWLPPLAGLVVALPTIVGLIAERGTIVRTPYSLAWQTYQSVPPGALSALGGYFPGYADRMGLVAAIAVWVVLALALAGVVAARTSRAVIAAALASAALFLIVAGTQGPLAAPYTWIVRNVPESGVFRELYDLAGIFAAALLVPAAAALRALRPAAYASLAAGVTLAAAWAAAPPSDLWVGAEAYPHPQIAAAPFTRVAFFPAFQPLGLRGDGGDGADPDTRGYPGGVAALNEYLPAFPVNMALARYEQRGDVEPLRALGVGEAVSRGWLISRANDVRILLAASPPPATVATQSASVRRLASPLPLVSTCATSRVVALPTTLDQCDVFFADAGQSYPAVAPLSAGSDSVDPRTDWIDARLGFANSPEIAQGLGGVYTRSHVPFHIDAGPWLLAYVSGRLNDSNGRTIFASRGEFAWLPISPGGESVVCDGLCELVALSRSLPALAPKASSDAISATPFRAIFPWLYVVNDAPAAALLRLNESYDAAWAAVRSWRALPHVRVDMAANGWIVGTRSPAPIIIVQLTSLIQMLAELCGIVCIVWLLKAAPRAPTKRGP